MATWVENRQTATRDGALTRAWPPGLLDLGQGGVLQAVLDRERMDGKPLAQHAARLLVGRLAQVHPEHHGRIRAQRRDLLVGRIGPGAAVIAVDEGLDHGEVGMPNVEGRMPNRARRTDVSVCLTG